MTTPAIGTPIRVRRSSLRKALARSAIKLVESTARGEPQTPRLASKESGGGDTTGGTDRGHENERPWTHVSERSPSLRIEAPQERKRRVGYQQEDNGQKARRRAEHEERSEQCDAERSSEEVGRHAASLN